MKKKKCFWNAWFFGGLSLCFGELFLACKLSRPSSIGMNVRNQTWAGCWVIKGEMKSTIATTDSIDILTPTRKVKFNHNINRICYLHHYFKYQYIKTMLKITHQWKNIMPHSFYGTLCKWHFGDYSQASKQQMSHSYASQESLILPQRMSSDDNLPPEVDT